MILKSQVADTTLHGVAVVSAIISAADAKSSAQQLSRLVYGSQDLANERPDAITEVQRLVGQIDGIIKDLGNRQPLCHNMTNLVVQNFAANVALAM